jgi:hypothetical protein
MTHPRGPWAWAGGRKMFLALLFGGMAFVLALLGKLTADFSGVLAVIYGGFAGADAHITAKQIAARVPDGE